MSVYGPLLKKYDIHFRQRATEDELMVCLSSYRKKSIINAEPGVQQSFHRLKIFAINEMLNGYQNYLRRYKDDESIRKILEVHMYLVKERNELHRLADEISKKF
jgi:hypothetical protein